MPFVSQHPKLKLSISEVHELTKIERSRTESFARIERAGILLSYHEGKTVSDIARKFETNRPKVERTIDKALQLGAIASLDDLPRKGKPTKIPAEANAWVLSLACQKPKDLGYAAETWTMASLAKHIHNHCLDAIEPSAEITNINVSEPFLY